MVQQQMASTGLCEPQKRVHRARCPELRKMAPRAGFEPATNRLTAGCSTTELPGSRSALRLMPVPMKAAYSKEIGRLPAQKSCYCHLSTLSAERAPADVRAALTGEQNFMAAVRFGGRKVHVPGPPVVRVLAGFALILCGVLGFLPVLGFWMLPLGVLVLSVDLHPVRKMRRRIEVWWGRRQRKRWQDRPD